MDIRAHVVALNEQRAKAGKALNDHWDACLAAHPGQPMNEEEKAVEARIQADIDSIEDEIRRFVAQETREKDSAELRQEAESLFGGRQIERASNEENDRLTAWLRNGNGPKEYEVQGFADIARMKNLMRSGARGADLRAALLTDTGSIGSAVPTDMAIQLYEYLENSIAMFRAPTTKIDTAGGNPMEFPKLTAHAIATQVIAEGTALAGTDPTFDKLTLGAYKYGELVQLSSEAVQDTSFDVTSFVARDIARALARKIDADLVTGGGSTNPQGIMGAAWGTVATGGTLIKASYDTLIDLVYGVADEYVVNGSAGWLMKRATAGELRKLRDGAGGTEGAPLWQPSTTQGLVGVGEPDRLLDHPVYTDPNVAAQGSAAKAIWFGDFASYYVRRVGNPVIERSDEFAFNTDLVSYRGKWRVDGDVIDTAAGLVSQQKA